MYVFMYLNLRDLNDERSSQLGTDHGIMSEVVNRKRRVKLYRHAMPLPSQGDTMLCESRVNGGVFPNLSGEASPSEVKPTVKPTYREELAELAYPQAIIKYLVYAAWEGLPLVSTSPLGVAPRAR